MKAVKIATILLVTSLIIAFIFTVIAFSSASNSQVSIFMVLFYFIAAGVFYGVAAIVGLKQVDRWGRFVGVAAVVAAIYMIIMGVVFVRMLSSLDIPVEYTEPGSRPDTYEAPPTLGVPELDQ